MNSAICFRKFLAAALVAAAAAVSAIAAGGAPGGPLCIGETCYLSADAARAAGVSEAEIAAAIAKAAQPAADAQAAPAAAQSAPAEVVAAESAPAAPKARVAQGYMKPKELLAFLRGDGGALDLAERSILAILALVFLGGLAANLTPCVLPLAPVNLMLVGKGWRRGLAYGAGITVAYGVLGLAAAFGGMAFGTIQSNPWFNAVVAVIFTVLALAMSEVFFIDFTKFRANSKLKGAPFLLGMGSAVLAGACVEPILLATLVLTAKWFAAGRVWAVALPFVLGAGMGTPWPFAAAGFSALPKPGKWMRWVTRSFAVVMLAMAGWYGWLSYNGFRGADAAAPGEAGALAATPATWAETFRKARESGKPVFVDVWATWCKNCLAMEKETFADAEVRKALGEFTVIRLQAENPAEFAGLADFAALGIKGFPALVIFE